ncbi:hypothetical protein niasHS_012996 [Heterodera schachtii]|uniref:Uncharacterized protein n=1 Tax=Heterodera schachtii TaxID=97005 RepID=A0ABD2INE9_HETSC
MSENLEREEETTESEEETEFIEGQEFATRAEEVMDLATELSHDLSQLNMNSQQRKMILHWLSAKDYHLKKSVFSFLSVLSPLKIINFNPFSNQKRKGTQKVTQFLANLIPLAPLKCITNGKKRRTMTQKVLHKELSHLFDALDMRNARIPITPHFNAT